MLYINLEFVSNLFLSHTGTWLLAFIYNLKRPESSLISHPYCSILHVHVHYNIMWNSQMSESHVVDMVASRHALQLTHCSMSTSLFSQPYCAQCNGDSARGFANHVNGWKKLRKKPQLSLKGIRTQYNNN